MDENVVQDPPQSEHHVSFTIHKLWLAVILLVLLGLSMSTAYLLGKNSEVDKRYNPIDPFPTPTVMEYPRYSPNPQPTAKINKRKASPPSNIPTAVDQKYMEIEPIYKDSLGAGIRYCVKGSHEIYQVWGSGGYTGVEHYFSMDGAYLGRRVFSDALTDGDNKQPDASDINITEYSCLDMRISEASLIAPPNPTVISSPKPTKILPTGDIYPPIP